MKVPSIMNKRYPIDGFRDSLWSATAVDAPVTFSLNSAVSYDVTIIGAGVTGLSAAFHLSVQGISVCVVDAADIGSGASGRSGGQINMGLNLGPGALIDKFGPIKGERLVQMLTSVPNEVFQLIQNNDLRCDPVQNGWIQSAVKTDQMRKLEILCDEYRQYGGAVEMLDQAALELRTGAHGYTGGILCSDAGSVQPLSYTRELARIAIERGAKIYTRSKVTGLGRHGDVWHVTTEEGRIVCSTVLVCTNGYTDKTLPGLAQKIVPVRSILIASEPLGDILKQTILRDEVTFVDKRRMIIYFRYDRDGRLCIGDHGPMRDVFRLQDFTHLKHRVTIIFPQLTNTHWDFHWGGRIAMTRNSLPFIHKISPDLTAAMGYNGRGMGMGTVMGRILADHVSGTPDAELDFPVTTPQHFSLHRFHSAGVSMTTRWLALREYLDTLP